LIHAARIFLRYDSIFVLSNKCHVSCNWDYPGQIVFPKINVPEIRQDKVFLRRFN
jgi:hypothetical protein